MHKFSEFAEEPEALDGTKRRIDDLLNTEITVFNFRFGESKVKDGEYLTIQFELENERYVCFTGSKVLTKQARKYKDQLPFLAVIKKINSYYTFT